VHNVLYNGNYILSSSYYGKTLLKIPKVIVTKRRLFWKAVSHTRNIFPKILKQVNFIVGVGNDKPIRNTHLSFVLQRFENKKTRFINWLIALMFPTAKIPK